MAIASNGFHADHEPRADLAFPCFRTGRIRIEGLRPLLPIRLALWAAPRSYTGQDVAEFHLVGSPPLASLVLASCLRQGARHAQPGEFTLRAFLSGRIDLTRAEAVLGVIDAHNPAQLEAALEQLAGGLSGPIVAMRERLLNLVAHLEANLDFTEEPDVDPLGGPMLVAELESAALELGNLAQRLNARDRPLARPRVVLVGPPNAGKSRLFNTLIGRDCAIVSALAGTTRDYLSSMCDCDGISVELIDTAGVESGRDSIASQAQALRVLQTDRAELLLECRSADAGQAAPQFSTGRVDSLKVWTKGDLAIPEPSFTDSGDWIVTSAATGQGLEELRLAIADRIRRNDREGDLPAGTAARCRGSILSAESALRSAAQSMQDRAGDELVAFDLRQAVDELGKVVGAVVTEDILDRIFRRFCIGK
jgi:tRNA modification GTPase